MPLLGWSSLIGEMFIFIGGISSSTDNKSVVSLFDCTDDAGVSELRLLRDLDDFSLSSSLARAAASAALALLLFAAALPSV